MLLKIKQKRANYIDYQNLYITKTKQVWKQTMIKK